MARKTRIVPLMMLTACPSVSWAMGLGEIDLQSALNQPMQAEIAIVGASADELGGLNVQLAPRSAFDRLGLDRPQFLSELKFLVTTNGAGDPVLRVSSSGPITEPFVTFLVEARWARGSLLREYTVLLDPPTFVPESTPAPAVPVTPPVSARQETTRSSGTVLRQPAPAPAMPKEQPAKAPYTPPEGSYRIGRGDTLWAIADRYRPAGVTVNQMMVALYDANPQAFSGNINRLRAGSILRVPSASELQAINDRAADSTVREHMKSWQPGSGMVGPRIEPSLKLVPPSEPEARPAPAGASAPAGDGQTEDYLRQEIDRLRRELASAEDRLEVQSDEISNLQQNLEQARELREDLAATPAAADQAPEQPAAEPVAEAESEAQAEAGQVPAAAEAVERARRVVSAPVEPESFADKLLGWLISPFAFMLMGLLAVVGALLVFLRLRKKDQGAEQPWDDYDEPYEDGEDEVTQEGAALSAAAAAAAAMSRPEPVAAKSQGAPGFDVEEEPDFEETANLEDDVFEAAGAGIGLESTTIDPEAIATENNDLSMDTGFARTQAMEQSEDSEVTDPVAEADFHMAYGLYDQAADILREAVRREPARGEYQMKLAEVYFVWGNQDQFLEVARNVSENRDAVGASNWEKILIMGRQLLPENALFGELPEAAGSTDLDLSAEDGQDGELDLELFGEEGEADDASDEVDLDFGGALDFSGDTRETPVLDEGDATREVQVGDAMRAAPAPRGEDLDMELPAIEQTAEIELDDLGLDVSLEDSFIGRLSGDDFGDEDALAAGDTVIGDDDATQIARVEDVVDLGTSSVALDEIPEDLDFDLGQDLDVTGNAEELGGTAELTGITEMPGPDATAELPTIPGSDEPEATAEMSILSADDSMNLDLGGMADAADTMEQPAPHLEAMDEPSETLEALDVGDLTMPESEALTLSEIGTKLDLARAYMDMGDSDGARNILEEVVNEGDEAQRADAQRLLDKLP